MRGMPTFPGSAATLYLVRFNPLLILAILIGAIGCRKDPAIPDVSGAVVASAADSFVFRVPAGWPQPAYTLARNPLTQAGARLGRKLFFDPILSRDSSTSCGSCHQPTAAFAHAQHTVSHGIEDRLGRRNSPGLFNLAWHNTGLMWDGGVNHLEIQPITPIQQRDEMDETLAHVLEKLSRNVAYRQLFKEAYGDEEVTSERMLKAMAQFMAVLISADARWDKVQRGAATFTDAESRGQSVFSAACQRCHTPPLFSDFSFRNNGLPVSVPLDSGRAAITTDPGDLYRFKVPSLRNLAFTAPYMHDGTLTSLDAVLDHYATGIQPHATLDAGLQGGIQLSAAERADLKAFLATLNDEAFIRDERFKQQ